MRFNQTSYVCDGENGLTNLIAITSESGGSNCSSGGVKIDSGLDMNANSVLDSEEINFSYYVCNGEEGSTSLTNIVSEPIGANCNNGGVKIESGIDENGNNTLDTEEVTTIRYVCNGIDGGFDEEIRLLFPAGEEQISTTAFGGSVSCF